MIYIITHKKYKQIVDDGLYKNILVRNLLLEFFYIEVFT